MARRWSRRAKRNRRRLQPAGSLGVAAERIVSAASPGSAKDARRRSRAWSEWAAMARRAPPTRRWTGKKGRRRDDPPRQPRSLWGQTRTGRGRAAVMVARLAGVVVARALAGAAWLGTRPFAACAGRRWLPVAPGARQRGPRSRLPAVARRRCHRRSAGSRARPADRRPAALGGVAGWQR